jgi:hypothetical protein
MDRALVPVNEEILTYSNFDSVLNEAKALMSEIR